MTNYGICGLMEKILMQMTSIQRGLTVVYKYQIFGFGFSVQQVAAAAKAPDLTCEGRRL